MASKSQSRSVVLLTVSYETVSFWAVWIRSKRAVYTRRKVGVAKIVARFARHFSAQPVPNSCRRLWLCMSLYYWDVYFILRSTFVLRNNYCFSRF